MSQRTNLTDYVVGEIVSEAENQTMIQVMAVDETGKALVCFWMLPQSFVDVAAKITELFGVDSLQAEMDLTAAVPGMLGLMADPGTHVTFTKEGDNGA